MDSVVRGALIVTDLCTLEQIGKGDGPLVGGKGLSLGLMAAAGLPVPAGFCVTTAAYQRLRGRPPGEDGALRAAVEHACRQLGGPVAVRSSATGEDGAATSFAGQQETVLGVTEPAAVLDAIARCWASLDSDRAVAYRRRQGVDEAGLAMAVVVQRLVPAEVAGVLFTRDPLDPEGRRMLVEASWGLGESVVSGRVTPDRYQLDRETGAVLERHIATKTVQVTAAGPEPVPEGRRDQPCLDDARLAELADWGRRVEAFYGAPRDVEWAWAGGRFWLLQARPITAVGAAEREQVRREEIAALQVRAEPGGTVWSRFNLAEVLPEPLPMTWSVVRRLMSGKGGYGLTYRDLGFAPVPELDEEGVYDLVCGRPYCNLSREPRLYARGLPLEHSFAALKVAPHKACYPQARPNWSRAGWRFWMFLPITFFTYTAFIARLQRQIQAFAPRFRAEILPAFAAEVAAETAVDLAPLDTPALLTRLEYWIRRTLYDFARDSLKPTVLAGVALTNLEQILRKPLGPERSRTAVGELAMGIGPDPEADLAGAVRDLLAGRLDRAAFLERFGHRGSQEMELAQPRWAEDPAALDRLIRGSGVDRSSHPETAPAWEALAQEARLLATPRAVAEKELQYLQTYVRLRETAKHYLMKGYALIRRILVELDRRHELQGGIFYLTLEDLPRLAAGEDLSAVIAARRRRRQEVLSLPVPPVLFSDDLEAIGRPVPAAGAKAFQGIPLSAGVAEGLALVLDEPTPPAAEGEPYVLVCPSTDPAWVPLFVQALALVMETGGVLSHGAIVAREFGLPAVAGLPGIQRQIHSGQRLRVDGASGTVTVLTREP
jgi:pyruvate,water dikinase